MQTDELKSLVELMVRFNVKRIKAGDTEIELSELGVSGERRELLREALPCIPEQILDPVSFAAPPGIVVTGVAQTADPDAVEPTDEELLFASVSHNAEPVDVE